MDKFKEKKITREERVEKERKILVCTDYAENCLSKGSTAHPSRGKQYQWGTFRGASEIAPTVKAFAQRRKPHTNPCLSKSVYVKMGWCWDVY